MSEEQEPQISEEEQAARLTQSKKDKAAQKPAPGRFTPKPRHATKHTDQSDK